MLIKSRRHTARKLLLPGIAIAVLLFIGGGLLWLQSRSNEPFADTSSENALPKEEEINFDPPTKDEQQATDDNKQRIVDEQEQPNSPTEGKKNATPVITSASRTQVSAYIGGVFEDGGTCTATAQQDSTTVTKTSEAFANVSNTQCAPISWDSQLGSGEWNVTVTYISPAAEGQSEVTKVK